MTRAEEDRAMAQDCMAMGRPALALNFQILATQTEREEQARAFMAAFITKQEPPHE